MNEELEKAVRTWLEYEDADRYNEEKARELIKARIIVREALRSGYQLIDMQEVEQILKEADEKIKHSSVDRYNRWLFEICTKAEAFNKITQLIKGEQTND